MGWALRFQRPMQGPVPVFLSLLACRSGCSSQLLFLCHEGCHAPTVVPCYDGNALTLEAVNKPQLNVSFTSVALDIFFTAIEQ